MGSGRSLGESGGSVDLSVSWGDYVILYGEEGQEVGRVRATFHFEAVPDSYLDTAFSVVSERAVKVYLGDPPPGEDMRQPPPRSISYVSLMLLAVVVFGVPILYFMYLYF